jgi:hypothetical protein
VFGSRPGADEKRTLQLFTGLQCMRLMKPVSSSVAEIDDTISKLRSAAELRIGTFGTSSIPPSESEAATPGSMVTTMDLHPEGEAASKDAIHLDKDATGYSIVRIADVEFAVFPHQQKLAGITTVTDGDSSSGAAGTFSMRAPTCIDVLRVSLAPHNVWARERALLARLPQVMVPSSSGETEFIVLPVTAPHGAIRINSLVDRTCLNAGPGTLLWRLSVADEDSQVSEVTQDPGDVITWCNVRNIVVLATVRDACAVLYSWQA